MTSQKSKSPESIAMGIMIKSRKETGKLDPFYIHDHKIIFKEIIEAIKAERENNRLVLPDEEKFKEIILRNARACTQFDRGLWILDNYDLSVAYNEIKRLNGAG